MCLPQLSGGLAIVKGLTDYGAQKRQANLQYTQELEKQSLQLKQYQAEKEARYLELIHQMGQLRNQDIETQENLEDQKGDIALAAQAAKSRLAASQASSGLAVGEGTFGNILQSVGFDMSRNVNDAEMNAANKKLQTETERRGAELGARVPMPHISQVRKVDTRAMGIGAGLSIVSDLVGIKEKYGMLDKTGHVWSKRR